MTGPDRSRFSINFRLKPSAVPRRIPTKSFVKKNLPLTYTCKGICPANSRQLQENKESLGEKREGYHNPYIPKTGTLLKPFRSRKHSINRDAPTR